MIFWRTNIFRRPEKCVFTQFVYDQGSLYPDGDVSSTNTQVLSRNITETLMHVVGIDPGFRNFSICCGTVDSNNLLYWKTIDLLGSKRKRVLKQREMDEVLDDLMAMFPNMLGKASYIFIERQMKRSFRTFVDKMVVKFGKDRTKVVRPQDVKRLVGISISQLGRNVVKRNQRRADYQLGKQRAVNFVRNLLLKEGGDVGKSKKWIDKFEMSSKKDDLADSFLVFHYGVQSLCGLGGTGKK